MARKVPASRPDVQVITRGGNGRPVVYLLRSPRSAGLFELGEEEYFLFQQFTGEISLETVCERYETQFSTSLSVSHLEAFIRQLQDEGFLDSEAVPERPRTLADIIDPEEYIPVARFRLFNPDWVFRCLYPLTPWCFWRISKALAASLIPLAAYTLVLRGGDMWNAFQASAPLPFFALTLFAYLVLDVARVLVRGTVLIRYGVQVLELGVNFAYYLMPILYVDISGVPWIREKRKRFWVAFSPIYLQILTFSFSTVAWALTTPGTWVNTMWLGFAATPVFGLLLFNGNPLVKFDAYITLSIWTQIPSLRERALRTFAAWLTREPPPEPLTHRERRWFIIYGLLVPIYGFLHIAVLLSLFGLKLIDAFQGAGFIVALASVAYVAQRPLGRFLGSRSSVRWLLTRDSSGGRWLVRLALLGAVVGVLLIPYPYETGGPFTILPNVQTEIHCEIDGGRIEKVFVHEGDVVNKGQPLGQIDQREYETNLHATQAQLENAEAQLRLLLKQLALLTQPPNIEQIQSQEAEVRRLRTLVADYQKQLELTTLRAPAAARITTPLIDQKVGQYLKKGDLFATVEQIQAVLTEIQVPEADAPQVRVGERVKVVPWAYPNETFFGSVKEIAPIAATPTGSTANSVRVTAELSNADFRLKAQITGYAKIKTDRIPVWLVILRLVIRWFKVQFWYWLP